MILPPDKILQNVRKMINEMIEDRGVYEISWSHGNFIGYIYTLYKNKFVYVTYRNTYGNEEIYFWVSKKMSACSVPEDKIETIYKLNEWMDIAEKVVKELL
jgi:hypothetical protein